MLAAQDATGVVAFSSQWAPGNYSAAQVLGAPDVFTYGDNPNAWSASVADGSIEQLTLSYNVPFLADGVTVRESWGNGFVTDIEVRNASTGVFSSVSPGVDPSAPGSVVDYFVSFPRTTYLVDQVRVTIDTDHSTVWEEIDAVKLHGDVAAEIIVTSTGALTTTEAGGSTTFSVALNRAPASDVVVNLSSSDTTEGAASPSSLTFTPSNALTAQTVTVTGVDDVLADGDVGYSIVTLPATSGDPDFNGLDAVDVHLINIDDDSALLQQPASSVLAFSSQWSPTNFSAAQTLGPSDVFSYGDNANAWSPAVRDGTTEQLTLGYDTPVFAEMVTVRESWGNGFVTNVEVRNAIDSSYTSVFSGVDPSVPGSVVDFEVSFPRTTFPVDVVRVTIDTDHSMVWEEIDSVMLSGRQAALTLSVDSSSIEEDAGAAATTATVTRNSDLSVPLEVHLASDDVTEATVPATVTIPAGSSSVTFNVDAVDDTTMDGTQLVTLSAVAPGHSNGSDLLQVADVERLTVAIAAASILESAGAAATTATVTRADIDDLSSPLTVALSSSDTSEATVPASVTIPAGSSAWTFDVDAVDDTLLDDTQTVTIEPAAAGYFVVSDTLEVLDDERLSLSIVPDSFAENAGPAAAIGTVTRSNTDLGSPLTVHFTSDDTSEATVAGPVTIPAGSSSASFTVGAVDDSILDGTQTVTITATAGGYGDGAAALQVTDNEALTLSIAAASISESAGAAATTGTVTRGDTDTSSPLTVTLSSNDTTEAQLPATVVIPSGASSASFDIDAVDDTLADGTQTVTISVTASGFAGASDTLDVTDDEALSLSLAAGSISENAGTAATTGTVVRGNSDISSPLTVTLSSDDTTEAIVPATVTIPAGSSSWTFDVDAVDDTLLDGTQTVTITATASGLLSAAALLDVTDVESLTVSVAAAEVAEDDGPAATTATVTRGNTDISSPLLVTLTSSDTSEATVPAAVTIPAGSSSWTFVVDAVDDASLDGTQTVTVAASASGYATSLDTLDVTDVETLTVSVAADSIAENAGPAATTAVITRSNSDDSAAWTVTLSNSDTSEAAIPSTVVIPAGSTAATIDIDAVDDALLDGTQTVTITASAAGFMEGDDTLDVTDVEDLSVSIAPASIPENAGAAAATGTITRGDTSAALTVTLTSDDTTEATVPATVTIPAGSSTWTFGVDAVDDSLLDGTQTVTITATAAGLFPASDMLDVTDVESLTISVAAAEVAEDDGPAATTATVTRGNTDTSSPLLVTLTSSDTSEATVPATVTIPAGSSAWTFDVDAVDDASLDGTQTVTVTASAAGYATSSDTLDVTDVETLTVSIAADSIAEDAGAGATTAVITRSNTDDTAAWTVTLSNSDTSEAAIPSTVVIPAGSTSATIDIDAVDDTLLDGTQTVTITASAAGFMEDGDTLDVTDVENLSISVTPASIPENAGAAAATGTITRGDASAEVTVTLTSDDTTEATVPATVTIPAGSSTWTFDVAAVDDALLDGTQTVTITAAASGFSSSSDSLDVLDVEVLTLTIAAVRIAETSGPAATTGTVTRGSIADLSTPLTVTLTSSDTTEATVPGVVTIPAGSSSWTFAVNAVDDAVFDGTQTVTVGASAAGYSSATANVDVTDVEQVIVQIDAAEVVESDGPAATTATVLRTDTADLSSPLTVWLASSDTTEATVPTNVVIPAGSSTWTFDVNAVDDTILDGAQTITISPAASRYFTVSDTMDVLDDESITLAINDPAIAENAGPAATTATITRSNTDVGLPLTVALANDDTTEAAVPSEVVIPAGSTSATFSIDSVDDLLLDGTQTVTITASASGYAAVSGMLDVTDAESLTLSFAAHSIAENAGPAATTAVVTRSNVDTGSPLTVNLSFDDASEASVPATVTIPAGSLSWTFKVAGVDDQLLDGTQTVTLTASAAGYASANDSLNVTDHETLTLTLAHNIIEEDGGSGATTATVTRSNTDRSLPLTVTLANSDTSEVSVPSTVTIPANSSSVTFDVDAVDDTVLDGLQSATITASASGYVDSSRKLFVSDIETLSIMVPLASIKEDAGPTAMRATVRRHNSDLGAALTVTLRSDDTTEAIGPSSVTIPAGQSAATFFVSAVDDNLLDGTQMVTITAAARGYIGAGTTFDVRDAERLTISLADSSISENAGPAATTATVTRSNTDIMPPLEVTLTNSDPSEASFLFTVTIPADFSSAMFDIDAVDDNLLDGTQTVVITAVAAGYSNGVAQLDVTDEEGLTVVVAVDQIAESAGPAAASATVIRTTDTSAALTVTLASNDSSEATVPPTVIIPAGSASATFEIDAQDDSLLDGTQTVTITASAAGHFSVSDMLDVTDDESLTLLIADDSVAEDAGPAATSATVTRGNTDIGSPLTVSLSSNDTTEASVPPTVIIPAGSSSWTFHIAAVDDTLLDGTQSATIVASAAGYSSASDGLEVSDVETLTISISAASISEDAGPAATTATVTRSNTDNSAPLTVTLTSSDTTEATVPASVTIPAGSAAWTFDVDAIDDPLLDGTQTVTIAAAAAGYVGIDDSVDVTDVENLGVVIGAASVREDAGPAATTGTVTRSSSLSGSALTISLTSSDTSEAIVPSSVTIPSGSTSVTFDVDAVDDALLDGTQQVTITASATAFSANSDVLDVTDVEHLTLSILAASVPEDAGPAATTATVTRGNFNDLSAPLTVTLVNSDTSEAAVPSTVVIPAGSAFWTFDVDAVDDDILDGTQTVTLHPSASGYVSFGDTLDVTDVESLTLSIAAAAISEDFGPAATTATVTRNNTDLSAPLVVNLSSSDVTEAAVPGSITIPAGSSSWTFDVDAVDDLEFDGTQTVTLTASAAGYSSATDTLDVTDVETLTVTVPIAAISENAGPAAMIATVTRNNIDNSDPLVVTLTSTDTSEATVPSTVTIPAGSSSVSFPVDAVDDTLLDGRQPVTINATAFGYFGSGTTFDVLDAERLTITLANSSISENAGPAATTATVTRSNTGRRSALTVTLTTSDTSEATVPATVTIPGGAASVTFAVDAVDDSLLDGTQSVTLTPAAAGYSAVSAALEVNDYETLTVAITANSVSEGAGSAATTGTVLRGNTDLGSALTVQLTSSDLTEATVPATVVIPAGSPWASFDVAAVDDAFFDGTQTVTISPSAPGYVSFGDTLDVADDELGGLTLTLSDTSISEDAGSAATSATVTRTGDTSSALVVSLLSSDDGEAAIQAAVTIPSGSASVSFAVNAVDDSLLDGTQTVLLTATAAGYGSGTAPLDVTDAETLSLAIAVLAVSENAGASATTATVTRGNTDLGSPLLVSLSSNDTTEATVPPTVTIPAGSASAVFGISAIDDALLDGTQTVTISATASGYAGADDSLDVVDAESLFVSITDPAISEDAGSGATTATVTRSNTDLASALTVNLASDDTSEAAVPATVTIPAGSFSTTFAIDAVDDDLLDGPQTVTIMASQSGYAAGTDSLTVNDAESLTVTIAASAITESAGSAATTGTVTRSNTADLSAALSVTLASSDLSEASVPATVTIPAGSASQTFDIAAVDDAILDGTQTVTVSATAAGYSSGSDSLDVTDDDVAALTLTITAISISETAGAAATSATVTRNSGTTGALTVTLLSNDTSEAIPPPSVTIPAGSAAVSFFIDAIDDNLLDGTQTATITAAASGHASGTASVDVTDFESLSVSIAAGSVLENAGAAATTATVTRSDTDDLGLALTVSLSSSDTSEATVPATVTIPAGSSSVVFDIDAVDDAVFDGSQTVTISASRAGYVSGSDTLDVVDDEVPTLSLSIAAAEISEAAGVGATTATVVRNGVTTSDLTVSLANSDTSEASVPAAVVIPSGSSSVSFAIDAVDDALLDGSQTVTVTASAAGHVAGIDSLNVTDAETLSLVIAAASISETAGSGATSGTVTRSNTDTGSPLTVTLTSNDTTEATVPATVTIPAGFAAASFDVAAVDDLLADGTHTVTFSASAAGYSGDSDTVDVTDNESQALTVSIDAASISEGDGPAATIFTVTRNSDTTGELLISLASSDTTEATVPSFGSIPAGSSSAAFVIDAVDDLTLDGTQTVTITASAASHVSGSDTIDVTDNEVFRPHGAHNLGEHAEQEAAPLTNEELESAHRRGVGFWAAQGIDASRINSIAQAKVSLVEYPGALLGQAFSHNNSIAIDRDAGGAGWSPSYLAAVVTHELGHLLGLVHDDPFDVMAPTLAPHQNHLGESLQLGHHADLPSWLPGSQGQLGLLTLAASFAEPSSLENRESRPLERAALVDSFFADSSTADGNRAWRFSQPFPGPRGGTRGLLDHLSEETLSQLAEELEGDPAWQSKSDTPAGGES